MVLAESFFIDGDPVGKICLDAFTGKVTFTPKHGHTRLAGRKWRSVTACKKAVLKTYRGK